MARNPAGRGEAAAGQKLRRVWTDLIQVALASGLPRGSREGQVEAFVPCHVREGTSQERPNQGRGYSGKSSSEYETLNELPQYFARLPN